MTTMRVKHQVVIMMLKNPEKSCIHTHHSACGSDIHTVLPGILRGPERNVPSEKNKLIMNSFIILEAYG